jgi:hypothetical protein
MMPGGASWTILGIFALTERRTSANFAAATPVQGGSPALGAVRRQDRRQRCAGDQIGGLEHPAAVPPRVGDGELADDLSPRVAAAEVDLLQTQGVNDRAPLVGGGLDGGGGRWLRIGLAVSRQVRRDDEPLGREVPQERR